jgi:dipeptidyl-peptidase-4
LTKQVFSMNLDGTGKQLMTPRGGTNNAQFSSTFDYYVNKHSDINSPPTYTVWSKELKTIRTIENNQKIVDLQKSFNVSPVEHFKFKTEHNVRLNGYMIKPIDFDPNKKYPVFMYQYSGPGSQSAQDSWKGNNYWWFQMLAQNGYIVACVDGRGTGMRGEEFKKMTYLQLGKYETVDQIDAAKYLAQQAYVDGSRIGIYGWSYGGYMSSLCILKGNDVFKAAIAVAPVTSWKWYDTVYTERYMRTVAENEDGYANNSPVYFADRLKGSYLLVHGLADDNVHFQNTSEMANALIKANKQFDTYFYPNRNHGIYGDNARIHLFTKMTNFIYKNI